MALFTRQPFAELGTPRLQALQSAKNRQNAITPASNFTSPLKPTPAPTTGKRQRSSTLIFEDDDSENVDPSIFNSPTKKSRTVDGFSKPSKFSLVTSPVKHSPALTASPSIPSVRRALSSPNSARSTPLSNSRGSPKLPKRVGLLSKRRTSSSPFRRVDPPAFVQSSPALPFSIDAALSGTIPNYTAKAKPSVTPSHHASTLENAMPNSWFFEIHEDTPEQEAANMMEHSASVLDISSDDDLATKCLNEERGKENIPPLDFAPMQARNQSGAASAMGPGLEQSVPEQQHVKLPRLRKITQDAMDEDRRPLGDLPAEEFFGEGCDAATYVTVDVGLDKPSKLSKEFEFECSTPEKKKVAEHTVDVLEENDVVAESVLAAKVEIAGAKVDEPLAAEVPELQSTEQIATPGDSSQVVVAEDMALVAAVAA